MKFIGKSYSLHTKDIHEIWCRFAKFLWKSKFCLGSGSGLWFYFGFQYQTYISYIEDTHRICLYRLTPSKVIVSTSKRHVRTDRQTDGNFLCLFCFLRHTKHEHSSKGENFFFTHAITILSLFTYFVCDEKVNKRNLPANLTPKFVFDFANKLLTTKWAK